jgi:hypothetical protein
MARATAEGTTDARLFFHAAAIAAKAGDKSEGQHWLDQALPLKHLLLPSERGHLMRVAATLKAAQAGAAQSASFGNSDAIRLN